MGKGPRGKVSPPGGRVLKVPPGRELKVPPGRQGRSKGKKSTLLIGRRRKRPYFLALLLKQVA